MTVTNDQVIQAVFSATDAAKSRALAILQGEADLSAAEALSAEALAKEGPLLMGMGDSAKFLGISRATLWRMIRDGRLTKVEIYHNAYRLRRSDILQLVAGVGDPGASSSLRGVGPSGPEAVFRYPSSDTQGVTCG